MVGPNFLFDEGQNAIMGHSQQFDFLFGGDSIIKEAEYVELAAACTLEALIGYYWRCLLPCTSNPLVFLWLVHSDCHVECDNRMQCAQDMLALAFDDNRHLVVQSTHECDDEAIRT